MKKFRVEINKDRSSRKDTLKTARWSEMAHQELILIH